MAVYPGIQGTLSFSKLMRQHGTIADWIVIRLQWYIHRPFGTQYGRLMFSNDSEPYHPSRPNMGNDLSNSRLRPTAQSLDDADKRLAT